MKFEFNLNLKYVFIIFLIVIILYLLLTEKKEKQEFMDTIINNISHIFNDDDENKIKELIYSSIMDTINNQASFCSNKGNRRINIFGNMQKKINIKLSCVDVSQIENNIANNIANSFIFYLKDTAKYTSENIKKIEQSIIEQKNNIDQFLSKNKNNEITMDYTFNIQEKNEFPELLEIVTNEIKKNLHIITLKKNIEKLQEEQTANIESSEIQNNNNNNNDYNLIKEIISKDQTINDTINKIFNIFKNIQINDISTLKETTLNLPESKLNVGCDIDIQNGSLQCFYNEPNKNTRKSFDLKCNVNPADFSVQCNFKPKFK
jgi:hypothetical protein